MQTPYRHSCSAFDLKKACQHNEKLVACLEKNEQDCFFDSGEEMHTTHTVAAAAPGTSHTRTVYQHGLHTDTTTGSRPDSLTGGTAVEAHRNDERSSGIPAIKHQTSRCWCCAAAADETARTTFFDNRSHASPTAHKLRLLMLMACAASSTHRGSRKLSTVLVLGELVSIQTRACCCASSDFGCDLAEISGSKLQFQAFLKTLSRMF